MRLPPTLSSRPQGVQLTLVLAVPILFGAVCGLVLGVSEIAYLVLSLLAILGGFGAGLEHHGALEGALRGFAGGILFGTFILVAKQVTGADPKADLPDPEGMVVVITTLLGILLGALGGRWRVRHGG